METSPLWSRICRIGLSASVVIVLGCAAESRPEARKIEKDVTPATASEPAKSPPSRPRVSDVGFREAARLGDLATVQAAIEQGVDVNGADGDRRTALMFSAFDGHDRIVRLLLEQGARVNARDRVNRTALIYAASGPNPATVKQLLQAGADTDVADQAEGWTALMFAAAEGNADVVRLLLEGGADRTLRDVDGETAEHFAASNGHDEIVRLLQKQNGGSAP